MKEFTRIHIAPQETDSKRHNTVGPHLLSVPTSCQTKRLPLRSHVPELHTTGLIARIVVLFLSVESEEREKKKA
jgi:hypothetical protein